MSKRSERRRRQRQKAKDLGLTQPAPSAVSPSSTRASSTASSAASAPSSRPRTLDTLTRLPAAQPATTQTLLKLLAMDAAVKPRAFGIKAESRPHRVLVVCCKAKDEESAGELSRILDGLFKQYCTPPLEAADIRGDAPPPMHREPDPIPRRRTTLDRTRDGVGDIRMTEGTRRGSARPAVGAPPPGALETHSVTGYGDRNDDDLEDLIAESGSLRRGR